MTVKKVRSGGLASIVARQKLQSPGQQLDILNIPKTSHSYNIIVGFNEKDQLQLLIKDDSDGDKQKLVKDYAEPKASKYENVAIDDIANCVNIDHYPNCENTLVFYVTKNLGKEAIALKFENEQDFKRIYFTYKYFKMRNRLTNNANNHASSENLFPKKKTYDLFNKNRKSSIDDYSLLNKYREHDQSADNGITHISVQHKHLNSRFDQPMSLIGIRTEADAGEIDSIIYTDIDVPAKPDRKRLFHKKTKAPPPPLLPKENQPKVLKGEFVRVNVDRAPDVIPRDNRLNKMPDILMFRENKPKRTSPTSNLWSASNKVTAGYESDREEWKSSRSQFSTTAFDSLARPTKVAMALTLKKPQRLDPVQYYRLPSEPQPKLTPITFRPNNYLQRPPRLPRPNTDMKRNFLNTDHRKFTSLQSLELPKKLSEPKKQVDVKKTNYSNISHRITGLTNKLRDLGNPSNTLGRLKVQAHGDVANLKPVLKTNAQDGNKRPVVRTCSAEPPKKVTFSAFATVQVV